MRICGHELSSFDINIIVLNGNAAISVCLHARADIVPCQIRLCFPIVSDFSAARTFSDIHLCPHECETHPGDKTGAAVTQNTGPETSQEVFHNDIVEL